MTTRLSTTVIAIPVALAFIFGPFWTAAQDKAPSRTKWEYKIVQIHANPQGSFPIGPGVTGTAIVPGIISEKELTTLGEQGWELFKITDGHPLPTKSFTSTVYYFKRPK